VKATDKYAVSFPDVKKSNDKASNI
jgi:hypothetical protein